jgi:Uma2 family endonuclease
MASSKPRALIEIHYAAAAQDYLRSLPPEHFMEATTQATQRKITLESLDLVHARRPEIQVFNELLVQYERSGERRPGQVVPDNMVVVHDEPIEAEGSYDVPLQPVGPFWVLEYVSKHTKRKDYEDNFDKYEKELKVPYFLLFYPETQDLTLYHHSGRKYKSVPANGHGRHPIRELELEVELRDGWVRYWFRGELLPLPAELQRELDEARRQAEEERQRAEEERRRAEQERQRAEEEWQRAEQLQRALDEERQARLAAERELEQLRAQPPRAKNGKRPPGSA